MGMRRKRHKLTHTADGQKEKREAVVQATKQLSIRLYFLPLLSPFLFLLVLRLSPVSFIWFFLPLELLPLSRDMSSDFDAQLGVQLCNRPPKSITYNIT
jgi:hypothetical protein